MISGHKLAEATQMKTPNRGGKLKDPSFIVIHYTAGRSAYDSARWLCNPAAKASAHLVIGRDGALIQLADFNEVTWHAGQSEWDGVHGLNNHSIGIEMDNCGPVTRVNGRWRALHLGKDYADNDVVEMQHKLGGPVRGWLMYSPTQIAMLEEICRDLVAAYPSIKDVLGHDDVAVPKGRKLDPGPAMELDVLRSKIFGRAD